MKDALIYTFCLTAIAARHKATSRLSPPKIMSDWQDSAAPPN